MNSKNRNSFIVLSAVAAACPSLCCLFAGVGILAGQGTYTLDANTLPDQTISPLLGLPLICLGLLPWLLPLGVWKYAGGRPAPSPASGSSSKAYSPFQHPWEEADAGPAPMGDDTGNEM